MLIKSTSWAIEDKALPKILIIFLTKFIDQSFKSHPLAQSNPRSKQMSLVMKFLKNESGATAIEYGLIAAGISVAIIAVVQGVGSKLNSTFTSVQNALN